MATAHTPLRIGLTTSGGDTWTGGLTYQVNLLEALKLAAPEIEVYVLADPKARLPADYPNCHFIHPPASSNLADRVIHAAAVRFFSFDYQLLRTFQAYVPHGLDAIYPTRLLIGGRTARLFWIPDFQFVHLPHMYSPQAVASLQKKYLAGARKTHLVVLSSQAARQDFERFAPQLAHKGRVVSFVAHVEPTLYASDPAHVLRTYHLPEKFFYLPNQFWAHKNHNLVLEALQRLRQEGVRPFIVFTGNPIDSRNPTYFAGLIQKISTLGLRDQVALLGMVPHPDVYALIRQSVAVINPSLFEGWSTTVEEAKSVGKQVALSDIPVHREQNPPGAVFFDPQDAGDLAAKLGVLWGQAAPGPDAILETQARQAYPIRMRQFGNSFISAVHEAIHLARA
jgi:glycosyltransferase involved in cell wall biosynthesis